MTERRASASSSSSATPHPWSCRRTPISTTPPSKLAANAFSFAGQSCISVQRIYVERDAYDDLLARFLPRVEALVVGDPADEATDVGPLIDEDARDRVLAWIEEARTAGAEVLTGGNLPR